MGPEDVDKYRYEVKKKSGRLKSSFRTNFSSGYEDKKNSGRSQQQQTQGSSFRRIFSAGNEDSKNLGRSQQQQTRRSSLRRIFSAGRNNSSSSSVKPDDLDEYGYNDGTMYLIKQPSLSKSY